MDIPFVCFVGNSNSGKTTRCLADQVGGSGVFYDTRVKLVKTT